MNTYSDDPLRRVQTLIELIEWYAKSAMPEILDLLPSIDEDVRAESAHTRGYLGERYRERVGSVLLKLVSSADSYVRDRAVEALGLLSYLPAKEALIQVLQHDPDWAVRASAAEALGNYQDESLVTNLKRALRDNGEEPLVRAYAAFSIGLLAPPSFRSELDDYIAMVPAPDVLGEVLAASYRLGGQEHLPALLNLLKTTSEEDIWGMLNTIQDFTERRHPPTLLADAPQIREALTALELRIFVCYDQAEQILHNLWRLEQ